MLAISALPEPEERLPVVSAGLDFRPGAAKRLPPVIFELHFFHAFACAFNHGGGRESHWEVHHTRTLSILRPRIRIQNDSLQRE